MFKTEDAPCVIDSWWRAARNTSMFAWVPPKVFARAYRSYIVHALASNTVCVRIACDPDDQAQIYGWIAGDAHCVHWVYVKGLYRRNHIATSLLIDAHPSALTGQVKATHWSYACGLAPQYKFTYTPELFFTQSAVAMMRSASGEKDASD